MVRRFVPRFPILRTLAPRISPPLLPLTNRHLNPSLSSAFTNSPRVFHHIRFFQCFPSRWNSVPSSSPPSPDSRESPSQDASLSQRLKYLIRTYGWYALGVYLILSAVDFGVAFAGINLLGADQVSRIAASVKATITGVLYSKPPEPGRDEIESANRHTESVGHEGLYAMLILAYTVHKTVFVPVRVGLTAALTPKLVRWLSKRGWTGSAGTKRVATEMRDRMRSRSRE